MKTINESNYSVLNFCNFFVLSRFDNFIGGRMVYSAYIVLFFYS